MATSERRLWQKINACFLFSQAVGCGLIFATRVGFGSYWYRWLSIIHPINICQASSVLWPSWWVLLICLHFEPFLKCDPSWLQIRNPSASILPWLVRIPGRVDPWQASSCHILLHFSSVFRVSTWQPAHMTEGPGRISTHPPLFSPAPHSLSLG